MINRDDLKQRTGRSYWHESKARRIIKAWQRSGETLAGFARRHGVNRRRLVRWASRLCTSEPEAIPFHPIRVTGGDTTGPHAAPIEIDLGSSRHVRVFPGCATEDLRRVLTVLAEVTSC